MHEIGEPVVCVNDKCHPEIQYLYRAWIKKGEIYHIRDCTLGRTDPGSNGQDAYKSATYKVLLKELVNDMDPSTANGCQEELGFNASRFVSLEQYEKGEHIEELVPAVTTQKVYADS